TQRAFFDDKMATVKTREVYYGKPPAPGARSDGGLQIRQLGKILQVNGLDVQVRIVDAKLDEAAAKKEIVDNLARAGDYVIINYSRAGLGQKGGGHISPLGAYDAQSDSFLILDVNPNGEKTWVWADAKAVFAAMRTLDHDENRGFLLIKEGTPSTPAGPAK
ncbi:MAG TPA: phytochelatin synthase family protein, partial [Myxococcota bacterium]